MSKAAASIARHNDAYQNSAGHDRTPTRRAILAAAPVAAIVAAVPAFAVPITDQEEADALWRLYCEVATASAAAAADHSRAEAAMPIWARPGPRYTNSRGEFGGDVSCWPMIPNPTPSSNPGAFRLVRPSPASIKEDFDLVCRIWGSNARPRARATYRAKMRAFIARLRQQKEEKSKVGLPEINARWDALSDQRDEIVKRLRYLPHTPNAVAALILVEVTGERGNDDEVFLDEQAIGPTALRFLLPMLSGRIAEDVASVLAGPDQLAGELAWW